MINTVQVPKRILKLYKNLDANGLKLFYYFIGKIQTLSLAIKNSSVNMMCFEDVLITQNHIKITFKEIKDYLGIVRADRKRLEKPIIQLNNLNIFGDIKLDNNSIIIEFDEDVFSLLNEVNNIASNNEIDLIELSKLKDKYSINLYLYCLTILRLKDNKGQGYIQISIDKIKDILCGGITSQADKMFFKRFIKDPAAKINKICNINIQVKRSKSNLEFNVKK